MASLGFVRRSKYENTPKAERWFQTIFALSQGIKICPICEEKLPPPVLSGTGGYSEWRKIYFITVTDRECLLCGWKFKQKSVDDWTESEHFTLSILKKFSLNSVKLPMRELGAHLSKNVSDIFALEPRRFETLVEDVFRAHGYSTVLTQATRDGGADIVVVQEDSSKAIAIIECKKYKVGRKVGVGIVRMLIGAAVSWGVRRGYLVTTSDYSLPAKESILSFREAGYEIDLVALSDLVNLLGVYNTKLPPLHLLTERIRRELIEANKIV